MTQAIESLVRLLNDWEIQLLVLLSFTLQLFLFFAGSLRRRSSSGFLRLCIWKAYLGADFVAVYALGYLSRHDQDETTEIKQLAFFWAPFLLIHLGGQDTITAFSMEDNKLWLRHLLNLVVQIALALYVFWKSVGRIHNVELLFSGVLVFIAGIIKYVERTWCLKYGRLEGLESSTRNMPEWTEDITVDAAGYARTVLEALGSMLDVLRIFISERDLVVGSYLHNRDDSNETVKVVRLQLGLMYDELYTKALVLRTKTWMILRHVSQICVVVAFVLFHVVVEKQRRYVKADVAITYSLFILGFFLEVCSVLNSMMSPWTWKMFKDRKWEKLAVLSWFIFSSDIGWPEKKQRWPCSFGQYNFLSWLTSSDRPKTFSQRMMAVVRRVRVDLFRVKKKKIFWMSKMLDTWYVDADEVIMDKYVVKEIILLIEELDGNPAREWPNLGSLLKALEIELDTNFVKAIVYMHVLTELHLARYPPPSYMAAPADDAAFRVAQVCRKLSSYMMYLLVVHPSMLPLTASSECVLET
ncbi:hypothetical protein ACQ4PT_003403 [Festuca glaucescens]